MQEVQSLLECWWGTGKRGENRNWYKLVYMGYRRWCPACTGFQIVPETVEVSAKWQRAKSDWRAGGTAKAQDPNLHCVLLYSADLIGGATICRSKPWEKGNLSGQLLRERQAGVENGEGRPGQHLGSWGKALWSAESEREGVQGSLLRRNWGDRFERGNGERREEIWRVGG